MSDVLGHAYIEIKAISKGLDASAGKAIEKNLAAAGAAGGAALERSVAASAKKAGAALDASLGGNKIKASMQQTVKEIDKVAAAEKAVAAASASFSDKQVSAQHKLIAAQDAHATAVKNFGRDSLQARDAQLKLAAASKGVDTALQNQEKEAGRVAGAFQRGGHIAGTVFGAMAQNSQGALGPLGEVYEKVQGIGEAFETAHGKAGKAVLGIGSAVTGLGATMSVFASHDQAAEQQLSAAISGTGKSFEDYKGRIEETIKQGEKYGYTATQTMSALNRLTVATHSPDKALAAFNLTANIAAARHLNLDRAATKLGQSVNGNTQGLRQFGIQVANSANAGKLAEKAAGSHAKALDGLKKAQQNLKDEEARLSAGRSGSGHASAMIVKVDQEKYSIAVAKAQDALAKYGKNSTQYASAFIGVQTAQNRLTSAQAAGTKGAGLSVSAQIALRKAHEAVATAQDKVKSTGTQMTAAQAAAKKGQDSFNQILSQGNKVLGGQASAATNTFVGHMKAVGAQVEDTAAKVGSKFGTALTVAGPALMGFGAIMETGVIQKMGKGVKALAVWDKESKIVQAATKVWTGVQWLFNAAMDANPITITVIAIAALGIAIFVAYKKFKPFHDLVNATAGILKNAFETGVHWVSHSLGVLWLDITRIWGQVSKFMKTWGPVALAVLMPLIGLPVIIYQHWDKIRGWLSGVWTHVKKDFDSSIKWVKSTVSSWITNTENVFKSLSTAITSRVSSMWTSAKNTFNSAIGWIRSLVSTFWANEIAGWTNIWHRVSSIASSLWGAAKSVYNTGVGWVKGVVSSFITDEINGFTNLWHRISGIFSSLWTDGKSRFSTGLTNIRTTITNWATGALSWLSSAGKDIVNGLVNGVTSMSSHALDAVKGVGSSIVNGVKSFFGIHSPSTVMAELGGHMISGLIQGIVRNGKQVPHLLKSVFGNAAHGVGGAMGWLEKQGGGLLDKVMGGAGNLGKAFSGILGSIGGGGGGGGAAKWAGTIREALAMAGAPQSWIGGIESIITHESGGNPKAINLTDSNAQAGHPSQGLMQTIPTTFAANAGALAKRGITDPLANIFAGIRYIMNTYGNITNVPGIRAMMRGGAYQGYAAGGSVAGQGSGDTVPALLTPGEFVIPRRIVSALGLPFFESIRAQKFASGGLVTPGSTLHVGHKVTHHHTTKHKTTRHVVHKTTHKHTVRHQTPAQRAAAARSAAKHAAAARKAAAKHAEAVKKAHARAVAASRARHLTMSMQNVSYGESKFAKSFKDAGAAITANPLMFTKYHASLIKTAEGLLKTATANEVATRGTTKHTAALKAQAAARTDLNNAQKMVDPKVAAASGIGGNFKGAMTQGMGLADMFNYQPGYGAVSAKSVIASLKAKLATAKAFSGVLMQLAKKGLGVDMINELIAAGPQAGMGIARQLLSDPSSIKQIQDLERQIGATTASLGSGVGKATVARSLASGDSALGHLTSMGVHHVAKPKPKPAPKPKPPVHKVRPPKKKPMLKPPSRPSTYTVHGGDTLSGIAARLHVSTAALYAANRKTIGSNPNRIRVGEKLVLPKKAAPKKPPAKPKPPVHKPAPKPAAHKPAAHPAAKTSPLMEVHGNLVVRNESDLAKIQANLYQLNAAQKRATGMGR